MTAILAAEAGVPVKHQLLIYPVTNMADKSESRHTFGEGFFLTADFMDLAETSYLLPDQDRRDPRVSVHFTEKIPENLAPASVVTAGFDPLRDEGEAARPAARRRRDRGGPQAVPVVRARVREHGRRGPCDAGGGRGDRGEAQGGGPTLAAGRRRRGARRAQAGADRRYITSVSSSAWVNPSRE